MSARRAGPFVANLAAATLLRVLVPFTLAAGGERFRYYTMSSLFPFRDCPSFHCFRVLPPLLAGLLPFNRASAFIAAGFMFEVLAGTMLWYIAERIHGSRRIAALSVAWFWVTWGPVQSFNDPLLIADPVQMFWSLSALYLLLGRHYLLALPVLVSGAAVKESVLLIPMIYALYVVLMKDDARHRPLWLGVLIAAPLVSWLLLRMVLSSRFGYVSHEDEAYLRATYFFGLWLPNLGPWPRNLLIAALYMFGACGAAWVAGLLGLRVANRRQRALTLASLAPIAFMVLFQVPDRGIATFPYATLLPAACFSALLPVPLTAALLAVNAAFSIRMNAAVWWLPRVPILLAALTGLTIAAVWTARARLRHASVAAIPPAQTDRATDRVAWASAGLIVALLVAVGVMQVARISAASTSRMTRWDPAQAGAPPIADDDRGIPGLAISPDSQWLAVVAASAPNGDRPPARMLWRRRVDNPEMRVLPGTEDASGPFWSPDSRAVAFFSRGLLKTVDVEHGTTRVIASAPFPHGGAWSARGVIVFAPDATGGLVQVPATGGALTPATSFDPARGERWHRWPSFLPDGDRFLFAVRGDTGAVSGVYLARLSSRGADPITPLATRAVYANGYLATTVADGLYLQAFDDDRNALIGDRRRIGHVAVAPDTALGAFDMSSDALVWAMPPQPPALSAVAELRRIDRRGSTLARLGPPADLTTPASLPPQIVARLPPHAIPTAWLPERQVLLYHAPTPPTWDVSAAAPAGAAPARVIDDDHATHVEAQFSPDGTRIAYVTETDRGAIVYVEPFPATGERWRVSIDAGAQPRWRADGSEIVYVAGDRLVRAVAIDPQPQFRIGVTRPLFEIRLRPENRAAFQFEYAMTPDGQEFLANVLVESPPPAPLMVVTNWKAGLFR